jgi:hypothetical protein
VKFQVLVAVNMKIMTFWDFMPYGIIDRYQLFRESLSTKLHNVKACQTVTVQYVYNEDSVSVHQAIKEFVDT